MNEPNPMDSPADLAPTVLPAPLVARPFTGFDGPADQGKRSGPLDALRVLFVYGGSAAAGFVLLASTMQHRPGQGAPASVLVEASRAREQARVAAAQAQRETELALAHVRR